MSESKEKPTYIYGGDVNISLVKHLNVIADLEKHLMYSQGVVLRGVNFTRDDEGWRVILKGMMQGKPVVAFTGGRYWQDLMEILSYEIMQENFKWWPDRYAK